MTLRTWPNIVRVKAYVTVHFEFTDFLEMVFIGLGNIESLYFKYFRRRVKLFHYPLQFDNLVELHLPFRRDDVMFEIISFECP